MSGILNILSSIVTKSPEDFKVFMKKVKDKEYFDVNLELVYIGYNPLII